MLPPLLKVLGGGHCLLHLPQHGGRLLQVGTEGLAPGTTWTSGWCQDGGGGGQEEAGHAISKEFMMWIQILSFKWSEGLIPEYLGSYTF